MALNLNRAARAHAASDMEAGKKYTKEELADQWLTIERVGLVDKDQVKHGKPVLFACCRDGASHTKTEKRELVGEPD